MWKFQENFDLKYIHKYPISTKLIFIFKIKVDNIFLTTINNVILISNYLSF